jgi:hypothetical protein
MIKFSFTNHFKVYDRGNFVEIKYTLFNLLPTITLYASKAILQGEIYYEEKSLLLRMFFWELAIHWQKKQE